MTMFEQATYWGSLKYFFLNMGFTDAGDYSMDKQRGGVLYYIRYLLATSL